MKKHIFSYLIYSLLFSLIAIIVAFLMGFAPFGKETMLTVDLGQQYIDFFSLFKEALTKDPGLIIYSFQKSIGGEMIGLWAYYLLSPFNLILLFFNESNFDSAVTLISYLKLLSAGLTMMYFIDHKYKLNQPMLIVFSLSYSLMSYSIVFLLNIMWLDALIMLPLISLGLDYLLRGRSPLIYTISLGLMLIFNYYVAYMICIFLSFYSFFNYLEIHQKFDLKSLLKSYGRFLIYSILGVLLAGITLFPTFASLLSSKATHTLSELDWDLVYTLGQSTSKLFIGSFNFDELSSGSPNFYVGLVALILIIFYFFNRRIHWQEKIVAGLIFGVYLISFRYDLLNIIWHGGQFPIWYEYRFSFTLSFFILILAIRAIQYRPKTYPTSFYFANFLLILAAFIYYYGQLDNYPFLSMTKLLVSLAFILAYLIIFKLFDLNIKYSQWLLLAIVAVELLTNTSLILNEFSYVDQSKFRDYTSLLSQATQPLQSSNQDFYRIHKNYMRTKNEAMYSHYTGLDHFGSTIDANLPELFGYLGQPDGNGFVAYTNGTLFTDDFFAIRYLLGVQDDPSPKLKESQYNLYPEALDLDQTYYPMVQSNERYTVRENKTAFGLGMEVTNQVLEAEFLKNNPIYNQNLLLNLLDLNQSYPDFFVEKEFTDISYHNVTVSDRGDGDYFTYQNDNKKDNYIQYDFQPDSDNPYYFTLPSQYTHDKVDLELNGDRYRFYTPYRRRQITNAAYLAQNQPQSFTISLKENSMKANLPALYEFNLDDYQDLKENHQTNNLVVTHHSSTTIAGRIKIESDSNYMLVSLPYDKNWQATVDGQTSEVIPVLNHTLMAIKVPQGDHQIELKYRPKSILIGLGLSLTGLIGVLLGQFITNKHSKKLVN